MFNIHASDEDELQFFQHVFAEEQKMEESLAASQDSSVLKNTHLQRFSNRRMQEAVNADLDDFKIELVDEGEPMEAE